MNPRDGQKQIAAKGHRIKAGDTGRDDREMGVGSSKIQFINVPDTFGIIPGDKAGRNVGGGVAVPDERSTARATENILKDGDRRFSFSNQSGSGKMVSSMWVGRTLREAMRWCQ